MSKLNYKQVANVERRTWDLETYEKKAKDRQERTDVEDVVHRTEDDGEEEFRHADSNRAGPEGSKRAFVKARMNQIRFEDKIGDRSMVSVEEASSNKSDGVHKSGVGWHCKVCDCFLKDNLAYLDHINGKKHQKKLGYTLRVEQSTKDDLKSRLAQLKQKKETQKPSLELNYDEMVKKRDEEEERRREERRQKRKERKNKVVEEEKPETEEEEGDEEEGEEPEIDPAMAAMMGFSGFGGSQKNV